MKISKKVLKSREKRLKKRILKQTIKTWKIGVMNRDNYTCQKCNKELKNLNKHPHHIISFQSVLRKFPELIDNLDNGILLCAYCHKFAPDSPHQSGLEFTNWFKNKYPKRYNNLIKIIKDNDKKK